MQHALATLLVMVGSAAGVSQSTVRGEVIVQHSSKKAHGSGDVVVWLAPEKAGFVPPGPKVRLLQKDKRFTPHLLAVTVGTQIEFPNADPFFHNVFSIYHGKPFDLGLYESGKSRTVRFDRPGVSYVFCNIHPDMSAVVVALETPYFAVTDNDGGYQISNVPPARYKLQVFYEGASEQELASVTREVFVQNSSQLPAITFHASDIVQAHLNKYGEPYGAEKQNAY
jgi:hypothetical protein